MDAYNFISQLSKNPEVKKVTVFRDSESMKGDKVDYILPKFKNITILKLIYRLIQIAKRRKLNPKLIVGIYEIPHGLLAVLAGKLLNVLSVVSIIGNPAYTKLRKGIRLKITMWLLKNASFVTVTGDNSKQFLVSKGIRRDKIFVLPNTLDFSQFSKKENVSLKYDIISLGRINKEKHIEVIVQIVSSLKEIKPDIRAAIAGVGPELESIKVLVEKLGLRDNIEILGYIPDEQLPDFFNCGRVFILTSETEGFPRTIIQAAACGTPVIASNIGDMRDVIDHQINGFLINDYNNVEEYSQRILQLFNDNELHKKFSENLNKKVREQFLTEKASEVWSKIIRKGS